MSLKQKTILLLGPQNTGKTSLFNHLTNSRFQTVNYPGSTVECAIGSLSKKSTESPQKYNIQVIDSPGITSLIGRSEDEKIAISCLTNMSKINKTYDKNPNSVVLVLDSTQLACQLALFKQLIHAGIRPIVAITMKDVLQKRGLSINEQLLKKELGVPVILINNRNKDGIDDLLTSVSTDFAIPSSSTFNMPTSTNVSQLSLDFKWVESLISKIGVKSTSSEKKYSWDLDTILLHPILGLFVFGGIMTTLFWAIFSLATPLMDGIDSMFTWLITLTNSYVPEGIIQTILSDGVITSIGASLIFVPQVAFLFFLIGLLESSGYLARGAALVDKPLSKIGLTGRSFVPLLSGNACAIPAMTAARSIPNKGERLATIFIIPLMVCSARLPVFGLFILLVLSDKSKALGGLMLTGIYLLSLLIAAVVARLLTKFKTFQDKSEGFVMALPRLSMPIFKQVFIQTFYQTKKFITGAGPTIFVVGMGLWFMSSFPNSDHSFAKMIGQWMDPIWAPMGVDWQVGVAILLSFAAREVFVSALAIIFAVQQESQSGIFHSLSQAVTSDGAPVFTLPVVLGLIIFFMISMQCLPTLAVAKKEMGGWKLPVIMTISYIGLAYVLAIITYQVSLLFLA
ncbi:ferrous iron transporter B [bacterium]|jgi:ferrous iron transport protein B|nr:ferrous iron transporter B [bacterium]